MRGHDQRTHIDLFGRRVTAVNTITGRASAMNRPRRQSRISFRRAKEWEHKAELARCELVQLRQADHRGEIRRDLANGLTVQAQVAACTQSMPVRRINAR
jgi:hypothetical protein